MYTFIRYIGVDKALIKYEYNNRDVYELAVHPRTNDYFAKDEIVFYQSNEHGEQIGNATVGATCGPQPKSIREFVDEFCK